MPQLAFRAFTLLALGFPRLLQLRLATLQGGSHAVECNRQPSEFSCVVGQAAADAQFPAAEPLGGRDEPIHRLEDEMVTPSPCGQKRKGTEDGDG